MRRALISVIIGTSLLSLSAFAAQGDVPSNPNVWAAVQDLQGSQASQSAALNAIQSAIQSLQANDAGQNASLTAIQTALTGIQNAINALTPVQSSVRVTPPINVFFADDPGLLCTVLNVANETRTVRIELLRVQTNTGAPLAPELLGERTLAGGGQSWAGRNIVPSEEIQLACRFTVLNGGTRNDIRAAAQVLISGIDTPLIAAE